MYQYRELGWFGSGYELLESPCECDVEFPGSIELVNELGKNVKK